MSEMPSVEPQAGDIALATQAGELDPSLVALAEHVMRYAERAGAEQVAVSVGRSRFVEVRRRQGKIERLRASTSRGLSLALFCDGRFSGSATSVLERSSLERFVDEGLALTRRLHPDPCRRLADPELYGPTRCADLELWDAGYDALSMDERFGVLAELEAAAQAQSDAIMSVTSGITSQASAGLQLHSNGFRGETRRTGFYFGASASAKGEGDRRPQDHAWVGACQRADLPEPSGVGAEAGRRAAARVGARKIDSRSMDLVVENRAAGRLVGSLLAPTTGQSLQQKRSCLADRLGASIASPLLTLVDEPLLPRGLGSRTFDGDGLAATSRSLVTAGELSSYLIDVYYGRKLERAPTGGSTSNLSLPGGAGDLASLVSEVERGVLVTSFLGGNSNAATGDFSFGVGGQSIVDGELAGPVGEMNITGNHLELWQRLVSVGDDLYLYSAWRLPSLRFTEVQFSGS